MVLSFIIDAIQESVVFNWPQFVIQLVTILIPVAIAIVNQNRRITHLETENAELHKDNAKMSLELVAVKEAYTRLADRYEDALRKQAGMRDRF